MSIRAKLAGLTVLVADDSPPMCELLRVQLQMLGSGAVSFAHDAEEAFAAFRRERPDLVLTDWKMPPTSGLDFVWRVRRAPDSPNPTAPIIMMTGEVDVDLERAARDAGVSEFLIKPFGGAELATRVRAAIEQPRDFVATARYVGPCRRQRAIDRRVRKEDAARQTA